MRDHPTLNHFAKQMRRNPTNAERRIWGLLRRKQVDGMKFRRQAVLGPFIVDFLCLQRRLVIEVDGGQHAENDYDARRSAWLEKNGFRVLRIWNSDVLAPGGCERLYRRISQTLAQPIPPRPSVRDSSFPSPLAGEDGPRTERSEECG
jgi:very-short-patch-repair endonuclease